MRSLFCLTASIVAASFWVADARSGPRACESQGLLKSGETRVVDHTGRFSRHGGLEYPFKTLSIGEKENKADPKNPNMCFRYQIENIGTERIEAFTWRDVDIFYVSIDPTPSPPATYLRNRLTEFDEPAVKNGSLVRAFERAEDRTRAYFTTEEVVEDKKGKLAGFEFFSYRRQMPGVVPALHANELPITPVPAYRRPTQSRAFPALRTVLRLGDSVLEVVSTAMNEGLQQLNVVTTVTVHDSDAQVFAPAFTAIETIFSAPITEKEVIGLANALRKFTEVPVKLEDRRYVHRSYVKLLPNGNFPVIFVSTHPITLTSTSGTYCVGVSSYFPLPLNAGGEYCNSKALKR